MEKNLEYVKEVHFEEEITEKFVLLGWENIVQIQRDDNREVFDFQTLETQIQIINKIDDKLIDKAINQIKKINDSLVNMNKNAWDFLIEGIKVYDETDGLTKNVKLISKNPQENKYQVIRQLEISDGSSLRYPDVVLYVNGLPMVVMELKSPLAIEVTEDAFNQNESLKLFCPKLWAFNVMNFVSNRNVTLYGSTLVNFKRMHKINDLKTKDGIDIFEYLFSPEKFYQFITTYSFFAKEGTGLVKYMAAPHQIKAVEKTIARLKVTNDNRGGVIWHTQGSGKSLTMLILAKQIIQEINGLATIVVITDRNTLDKQLFGRFLNANEYLRNDAVAIKSRKDLIEKLKDKEHFGIYFSTVQKFFEGTGALTQRDDVFVLVDEAHRTQNNIDGERTLSKEKEEFILKFGFARYMRDAFPNSKIVGFTGTPLMKFDRDTTHVFGDYNDIYSMNDSVADGATVPIHYEMRKVKINLDEKYLREMDEIQKEYLKTLDPNNLVSQQKVDTLMKSVRIKQILEDDEVILAKTQDILKHWEKRSVVLHGKAMIVANSRKAAFKYYQTILKLKPELKNQLILVVTESNKDVPKMKAAIIPKRDIDKVAEEFRKDNSQYKIAIVVDMWLTGFDVQDLDVLYIDKIIKWHNLMQAIARVNRTYEDKMTHQIKENGLIVDYIGIWKFLSAALLQYASGINQAVDISIEDVNKAKEKLHECFELVEDYYIKNLDQFETLNAHDQYKFVIQAYEKILELNQEEKNKFILLARKTRRFFKMAYSVLSQKETTKAKVIELINSLLSTNAIDTDEQLQNTIELIKQAIGNAVNSKTADVIVNSTKISKNLGDVASILGLEAQELTKTAPRVAVEFMKHSIAAQIQNLRLMRPVFAKKASDKLIEIISTLEKLDDVERAIEQLRALAGELSQKANEPLEFQDPQLQAFYEVISNDLYLKDTENSAILRQIATELLDKVKELGTEQYENNPRVKSKIKVELQKLLKTKYNYPPDHLGGISGILIDQITQQIRINKDYFRKDD